MAKSIRRTFALYYIDKRVGGLKKELDLKALNPLGFFLLLSPEVREV
jgi:hypothetical protein